MTGGDLLYLHRAKNPSFTIVHSMNFNQSYLEEIESDQLRIAVREEARWLLI